MSVISEERREGPHIQDAKKILVISDGPIGNDIWMAPMLNSLLKAGHSVDVQSAGFKHGLFPKKVGLLKSIEETDLNQYDHVILRKGPKGEVPEGRWKNHSDILSGLDPEKLIEIPYNEGWKEGSYSTIADCDISWMTRSTSVPRGLLNLVKELGAHPSAPSQEPLYERLSEEDRKAALDLLKEVILNDAPLVMIYAKTSDERKNYPEEKWFELARELSNSGFRVLFMGAAGDPELRSEDKTIASLVGKLSLAQGYFLMDSMTSLVISGDTHAGHAAAESGTPSLTLFAGSTIHELVAPYGDSAYILTNPEETPKNIEVSEVLAASHGILDLHPIKQRFAFLGEIG